MNLFGYLIFFYFVAFESVFIYLNTIVVVLMSWGFSSLFSVQEMGFL